LIVTTNKGSAALASSDTDIAALAEVGEVFINLAVAVVVDTITTLRLGRERLGITLNACACCITDIDACVGASANADVAALTEGGEGFINATIAVVIDAIAAFDLGGARLDAALDASAIGITDVDACIGTSANANGAALTEGGEVFIDLAIAVVVKAITDFGGGLVILDALETAIDAGSRSCGADAKKTCVTGCATTGIAFIDLAIAVVVDAVTDLVGGLVILDALEATTYAVACTRRTDTRKPRVTGSAAAGIVFVDLAIAVVIEAVADFGGGGIIADALKGTVDAVSRTRSTDTRLPGVTCRATAGISFIDLAVAVVIEAITDLGGGVVIADALEVGIDALGCACCADPRLTGITASACTCDAIINQAVAIVVDAIADLLCGVVDDGIHCILKLCVVIRSVISNTARDTGVTTLCSASLGKLVQAALSACADPCAKADHIGFDVIDVSLVIDEAIGSCSVEEVLNDGKRGGTAFTGFAVCDEHDVGGATFDGVVVDDGLEVSSGSVEGIDVAGSPSGGCVR
jgi:hypothetical protein